MSEHSIKAEINLYYDLYVPDDAPTKAPLLIAVHGYAAHKEYMMREARKVAPENFAIVSLQAPNKFWREAKGGEYKLAFGWLTDFKAEESVRLHHDFVLDVVRKLSRNHVIDPQKVFLYGFSQACALNFRFAFTHPESLKGIVGVCGGIPSDLDSGEKYSPTDADVFYLYGMKDEFYSLEKLEGFDKKLSDYLPNYSSKVYDAEHEITDEIRSDMKNWLTERS